MHVNKKCHFVWGLILADIFQPKLVPMGDWFWQEGTNFGSQNWSARTTFGSKSGLGDQGFSTKIGLAGPILGGTDFAWCDRTN